MARFTAGLALLAALFATGCAGHDFSQSDEWRLRSLEENALEFEERQFEQIERLQRLETAVNDLARQVGVLGAMEEPPVNEPSTAVPQDPDLSGASPETLEALAMYEAMFAGGAQGQAAPVVEQDVGPETRPENEPNVAQSGQAQSQESWDDYPQVAPQKLEPEQRKPDPAPKKVAEAKPQKTANKAGPAATYEKGLSLVRGQEPEKGRKVLESFVQSWPGHELVPNALYWIGESHYSEKRLDQAILTFMDVYRRYPKHPKASAALLKTAYSYEKLGDLRNARFYLTVLLEDFPDSDPAPLARRKMAQISG